MEIKSIKKEWNATILDILKAFMEICKTHNLRYYCCAGTAIGAARHHGMIPWDDDIDVLMPRPDYDRLLEIAKKEDFGKYEVVTPYNNESYPLYFSKLVNRETTLIEEKERPCIIGLYVDIFPLDATDDDLETAKALYRKYSKTINRLNAVTTHNTFGEYLSLLLHKETWGRFAIKTLAFFFRSRLRHRLISQMDEMSHRYNFDTAKNVLVNTGSYHYKEIFPKAWLGKGKEFPFEDTTVLLPEEADKYLRHIFGDYMQFPPVEQRVEKHLRYYLNMEKRESWDEIKKKLSSKEQGGLGLMTSSHCLEEEWLPAEHSTKVCSKPCSTSNKGFQPKAFSLSVLNVALVIGVVLPCKASSGISNTTLRCAFPAINSAN